MSQSPSPAPPLPPDGKNAIVQFDASRDDIAAFFRSILGRPQRRSRVFYGSFSIDRESVEQFFHLIDQRVRQQNDGHLLTISISVWYSDNSHVEFNDLIEFKTYNENKKIIPTEVFLSLVYLIKFNGKKSPERQEISVVISGTSPFPSREDTITDPLEHLGTTGNVTNAGRIEIEIQYTARTFGTDIESLLANYIDTIVHPMPKFKLWLKRNAVRVGWIISAVFGSLTIIGLAAMYFLYNKVRLELVVPFRENIAAQAPLSLNDVASIVLHTYDLTTNNINSIFSVVFAAGVTLSLLVGMYVGYQAGGLRSPGFLLFNSAAVQFKENLEKGQKRKFFGILAAPIGALVLNIIASVIFTIYIERIIESFK